MKEIAGYYENGESKLTVVEHDPVLRAYRVIFRRKMLIANLFRDAAYEEDVTILIETDKFERLIPVVPVAQNVDDFEMTAW